MDIKELTQHMHDFVRAKGWYDENSQRPQTLRNLAISLNLEASEVLEHFQWGEELGNPGELSGELADVALYLLQIASIAGIDLEQAILRKLERNYGRTWDAPMREQADASVERRQLRVTVFGGSQPSPGESAYQQALKLGQLIGSAGWTVLTGGYIGTMEAVSRGTYERGGHVIGVTCDEIEAWRPVAPNSWVQEEMRYPTLRQRLYALIDHCEIAVALPGGVGTLAEIAVMWSQVQTGASRPRFLILVGEGWQAVIEHFYAAMGQYVPKQDRKWLYYAPDVESAFELIQSILPLPPIP